MKFRVKFVHLQLPTDYHNNVMIKFPSFDTLINNSLSTILRFKWVVLLSLARVIAWICYTETSYKNEVLRNDLTRILYILSLAVPLAIAISLVSQRRQWKNTLTAAVWLATGAGLAVYYIYINQDPNQTDFYRFMLFLAGAHLLVSYIPFLGFKEINGFWQFNKTLFLQFLNATLYSATLFIGLLIAIQTIKFLFKIEFVFEIEFDLAIFIFAFFHTVFFLSKIPAQLTSLEQELTYPSGLKIFTQYVLLPLEVVYLVILYAYTGKILFEWTLPDGGVAYLTLAFSTAGILALLLLYPLREDLKERWIGIYSHRFYLALLPLIILLSIGIFRRINDYGVTENRYLVAVLAFWLAGITMYFLFVKKNDIRIIPISLSIICFLAAVGPWNIFSVAQTSQLNQFEHLVTSHNLLTKNNIIGQTRKIAQKDYEQLFSILRFFRERDSNLLMKFFPKNFKKKNDVKEKSYAYSQMEEYLRKYVSSDRDFNQNSSTYIAPEPNNYLIDIQGFKHLFIFNNLGNMNQKKGDYDLKSTQQGAMLTLFYKDKKIAYWDIAKKEKELRNILGAHDNAVAPNLLIIEYNDPENKARLVLTSVSKNGEQFMYQGAIVHN